MIHPCATPTPVTPRPLHLACSADGSLATLGALLELTKPRLAFFSIVTAVAGYAGAAHGARGMDTLAMLLGTTLAAGGALSLNQWWERDVDPLMRRTRGRPLPRNLISARLALGWSLTLGIAGVALLAVLTTPLAAAIAAATILIYGVAYTPLKRRTRWATEVGSLSGALPPLLGSAAAGNVISPAGCSLAAALLCWQMPHFFAIGWRYRADYRAAGFKLLPAVDATGRRTAAWTLGYTVLLAGVSLLPSLLGWTGLLYGGAVAVGDAAMLWHATCFLRQPEHRDRSARRLFVASIVYLPLMISGLLADLSWR